MNRKDAHRFVGWLVAGFLLSAMVFPLGGCKPVIIPLVAVIQYAPSAPNAGEAVVFSGRESSDPDAEDGNGIELYEWTFGDNKRGVGETVTHTYSAAGSYGVTLNVTDATGGVASTTVTIAVSAAIVNPPTAAFSFGPTSPQAGDVVTFSASESQDPAGMAAKSIAAYTWGFGDGAGGQGVTTTHTYAHAGAYVVTLTVTDDQGANGVTQHTVIVTQAASGNPPPIADFTATPSSPYKNQVVTFSAENSSDPAELRAKSIALYSWLFGDGSVGTGKVVTHSYSASGTYTVELRVVDDDGAVTSKTASIVVQDYVIPPPPPPPG